MKKLKKITFIGFLKGFGGAEKSMIMLANSLIKLGYDVTIICLGKNELEYDMNSNIRYLFLKDKSNNVILNKIMRLRSLFKVLKSNKPDIVISFWLQPAVYSAIIAKFIGFKTIYSERGDPSDKEYDGVLGVIRQIAFKFIDGFVFQTVGAQKYFSRPIQDKSTVISNPVYIKYDEYKISKKRKKVIINIGRLHEQKNQKLLIKVFAEVSKEYPEFILEIYGEGELKKELQTQIEEANAVEKILLKGTTKEIFDKIVDCSLFILSSDYEGMPNALMEAMALGVPCISSNCSPGGPAELISHGSNGLLFTPNNEKELKELILKVLRQEIDVEKIAHNAKKICHTHSTEKIFNQWERYVNNLYNGEV